MIRSCCIKTKVMSTVYRNQCCTNPSVLVQFRSVAKTFTLTIRQGFHACSQRCQCGFERGLMQNCTASETGAKLTRNGEPDRQVQCEQN